MLEQECLRSGTLPAIAYGYKKCSLKHKIDPQEKFCNNYPPCREEVSGCLPVQRCTENNSVNSAKVCVKRLSEMTDAFLCSIR